MSTVKYEVVQHDGGWAYKVGDVLSETFQTHAAAHEAAASAARRQRVSDFSVRRSVALIGFLVPGRLCPTISRKIAISRFSLAISLVASIGDSP